jgi:hypothetical protein
VSDEFLAEVKLFVADPSAGPRLADLLNAEAGRLIAAIGGDEFALSASISDDGVVARLDRYAALTSDLAGAAALGARWSGDLVRPLWPSLVERVVDAVDRTGGETRWADLSLYPGALLLHAAGVGALAGDRYDNLRSILLGPRVHYQREQRMALEVLNSETIMDRTQAIGVAGLPKTFAPMSERLAADLRPAVNDVVPDGAAFAALFDRFEYLLGLVYLDVTKIGWAPTGRYVGLPVRQGCRSRSGGGNQGGGCHVGTAVCGVVWWISRTSRGRLEPKQGDRRGRSTRGPLPPPWLASR